MVAKKGVQIYVSEDGNPDGKNGTGSMGSSTNVDGIGSEEADGNVTFGKRDSRDSDGTRKWDAAQKEAVKARISIKNMEELEDALAHGRLDEVAQKYSRSAFHDAATMPAVILMNHGRFEDLSFRDVEDLFNCLDEDASGLLDFDEIGLLLQEVLDPPCTDEQIELVYELTENADAGVTAQELYKALTAGPVKEHLKRLQRENRLKHQFEAALGINAPVERQFMVESIKRSVDKDDSFKTLPISLVNLIIFIFLVVAHLKIWERQQVERGLQNWIEGYGGKLDGPYFLEHVSDIPTTFDWLKASGLPAILGVCQNNSATTNFPACYVGTRSLLLRDVELKQTRTDGSELGVWLLHSEKAQLHLISKPGDFLGAADKALDDLRAKEWYDADTTDLQLGFDTYGKESGMFATGVISTSIDDFGIASCRVAITSVPVRAYPAEIGMMVGFIIADVIYVLCWIIPTIKESRDLIAGMRISGVWDGFVGYWGLWNVVDWVFIVMSIAVTALWIVICQAMQAEELQSLLVESDGQWALTPRAMGLDVAALEVAQEKFANITQLYFSMHLVMGGAAVSIMLKFFKAFQANPRLQLVTNTLVRAGSDIFHFSVVFMAVFLGFSVTGHILLGNDILQFRSFTSSIDTCFIVLMGEFGWYEGASVSDDALSSGLPFFVLMIWFWSYMVFVLLIMINMLLAIVLEHYTELVHECQNDSEAIALWTQTSRYMHQARQTRDHIPLPHILCELEDDDTPCHTDEHVTAASLQAAFPKMDHSQVEHLHQWLREEGRRRNVDGDDEMLARLKAMGEYVEHLASDLHVVKLNVAVCTSRLRGAADTGPPGAPGSPSPRLSGRRSGRRPSGRPGTGAPASGRISGRGQMTQGPPTQSPGRRQSGRQNTSPSSRMFSQKQSLGEGVHEQVEGLTLKIGEAIQQMAWQIGGATDKLLSQGSALEAAADQAMQAPAPQAVHGSGLGSRHTNASIIQQQRARSPPS